MVKGSAIPAKSIQNHLVQLVAQHKEHEREAQLKQSQAEALKQHKRNVTVV